VDLFHLAAQLCVVMDDRVLVDAHASCPG
jgi:hypothetical protein